MTKFLCTYFFVLLSATLFSQVSIWEEDFNALADGTTTVAGEWFSFCSGCTASDYFEVRSGVFSGRSVDLGGTWQTLPIDISGYTNVSFSLLASEDGDHEGPGMGVDYFDVYFSIDGGPFIVIEDWNGDGDIGHTLTGDSRNNVPDDGDWVSTTVTHSGLSGSSLVLRIIMTNNSGPETMHLDDVLVEGDAVILPVELLNFSATPNQNVVSLIWETSTEMNTSHFEIEKSTNGNDFQIIAHMDSRGGIDQQTTYQYEVEKESTSVYYRLQIVDLDGEFDYSNVLVVEPDGIQNIQVFPNPFKDHLYIDLQERSIIQLISIDGAQNQFVELTQGSHNLSPYLLNFPRGIILVQVIGASNTQQFTLVKQ